MKLLASFAALALAACSASVPTAPASTTVAPATAITESALAHSSAGVIPSFVIGTQSAQAEAVTPNAGVEAHSVYIIAKINGLTHKGYINGSCFLRYHANGTATGCGIYLKITARVKLAAGWYTGYGATGCLAAVGEFEGQAYAYKPLPITWYRTYHC